MKIAFSTLGCPDYSWSDIYTMAKDLGFGGIELRGLGQDIFASADTPFSETGRPKTKAQLKKLKLEISCISSGCALRFADKKESNIKELKQYIALASDLELLL